MLGSELDRCPCCGQSIVKTDIQSRKRHLDTIEKIYDVTLEEMRSRTKVHKISLARNHLWFLLIIEDMWSLTRAGEFTGHGNQPALQGTRRIANRLMGTHMKMSLNEIRENYWRYLGKTEEEIQEILYD